LELADEKEDLKDIPEMKIADEIRDVQVKPEII